MKRARLLGAWLILAAGIFGAAQFYFNFDSSETLPQGFSPAQTADRGTLAQWVIVKEPTAPSQPNAILVKPDPKTNHGACFNLLIYENASLKDLEISVRLKAFKGEEDQGGGVIWRARDKNNYYVVRWNPLEDNFRLYYVKNGRRRMLRSAKLKADPGLWHTIKVVHRGDNIKCYFDGELKLQATVRIFNDAGKFGLWTKADASTKFDDLKVEEIQ